MDDHLRISVLVRKPHVKRKQKRAITVQPGTGGVLCAPKNEKRSTIKSEDRENKTAIHFFRE
jgi:hypothetical protein